MRQLRYAIVAAAITAVSYAGGFWLELGNPAASAEAMRANAVLTVRAVGCHNPAEAQVSGMAVSNASGKVEKIPLQLTRLAAAGMYAVPKQWSGTGKWTLSFTARHNGATTSMLVNVEGDKFERGSAKFMQGEPTAKDVEALLARR